MVKMSKEKDFDPDARRMNFMLSSVIGSDKQIQYTDSKHVVKEKSFLKAVKNARKELGLTDFYPDTEDEGKISLWLMGKLAGQKIGFRTISEDKYREYDQMIYEVITQANEEAKLQYGWYAFTEAFIALGKEPKTIKPIHTMKMEAVGISEDRNSIVLRLDRGLSAEDYRKAWNKLKWFLNKPSTAPVYADLLKNKIYLDRQNGMTYGDLAKKYFPYEYGKDLDDKTDYARDKVKKIVARYKKPM